MNKPAAKSLKVQLAAVFIAVAALLLGTCWLANQFLLAKYYSLQKRSTLMELYQSLNEAGDNETLDSEEYIVDLYNRTSRGNISLMIVDREYHIVFTSESETGMLEQRLLENIFSQYQGENDRVLEQTDEYTMRVRKDRFLKTQQMELWGTLNNGDSFIMRTPLESIRESAKASGRLLAYIGIIVMIIGAVIIWAFANRITRPILELTELSKQMSEMNFSVHYTGKSNNEIGVLGNNMNIMSGKLEGAIAELKSANLQLMNDIEEKNKIDEMRKEFVANVTHELKTPIALIQGYAEGLQECVNDDPESREFYCEVIMDESAKMNAMVKKLLTLSRMEFGNQKVEMQQFDIIPLIKGVAANQALLMEQKGVEFRFDNTKSVMVWADEFNVEEVISNYLSNAIHHVEGENVIEIKVEEGEETARISVFNTGQTIPEDSIDRVWEKFYKVDKAHTREYGGTGIGLSIVKAIMESHQQAYGVRNWDNGVEFWIELATK